MSIDFSTFDQQRLLAERVKRALTRIEDKTDLLSVITTALDTYIDGVNNKVDGLSIPTKTSELTNDAKFQTDTDVANAIANSNKLTRKKIDSLSDIDITADDAEDFIYILGVTNTDGNTYFQQYMVINGAVEAMGTTKVDLEGYLTEDDVATDDEVDDGIKDETFDLGFFIHLPPEMHRTIFRGKNLGNVLTAKQKSAIKDGTFDDLWLGDYWNISGVNWRIADIDYWLNCGDTVFFTKHHLVVMPDTNLGDNKQMNTTNTTEGGYVGSLMRTSNMNDAKAKCTAAFGSNILSHRDIFCNAVTNGRPTGFAWVDSTIELPTEVMIYGCPHYAVMNDGTSIPMKYVISKSQLALFAVAPKFITTRQNYWLQDVVSAAGFARVAYDGTADYASASASGIGVRPVFAVGVPD